MRYSFQKKGFINDIANFTSEGKMVSYPCVSGQPSVCFVAV